MSAARISWLKVGGLALLAVGVIYATTKLNRNPAPPAEIAPPPLQNDSNAATQTRTGFPTILRAKPVTDAAPSFSPRYAPHEANLPRDATMSPDPQFDPRPTERYRLPTDGLLPDPLPSTRPATTAGAATSLDNVLPVDRNEQPIPGPQRLPNAVSPALPAPGGLAPTSSLPESEAAQTEPVAVPTTYLTVAQDSFWNISKLRYGGEGRYFKALYFHNRDRILRPDQIPAGIEIKTPPAEELLRLYPELCQLGQLR